MRSRYDELMRMIETLPLSKSLSKALRFAQEIKDSQLEKWIRLELHGYWNSNTSLTEEDVVPEYRTVAGFFTDDYGRQFIISDPKLCFINETRLRFGVIEIEGMIGAKGPLAFRDPRSSRIIQENLGVEVTTFNFSPKSIPAVLEAIRTEFTSLIISRKKKLQTSEVQVSKTDEIIQLKPNIYGIGVDLKAIWRKFTR